MSCYGILCNKKNHTNNNLRRIISMDRRSSRSQMFFKIGALKNFANFTEKHLCWSLFLIKLQAWRTLIKETPTQMFSLWNLRNFYQHLFYRSPSVAASVWKQIAFFILIVHITKLSPAHSEPSQTSTKI